MPEPLYLPDELDLEVPFSEKNEAKSLGAAWRPARRKWAVPAGYDVNPFARWWPRQLREAQPISPAITPDSAPTTQRLSAFLARLAGALQQAQQREEWVCAEVVTVQTRRGHYFYQLAEQHDGSTLAAIEGIIWSNQVEAALAPFIDAVGSPPSAGQTLRMRVRAELNPRFGLRLQILALDPNFTLGEMAAQVARVRRYLREKGLYDANRRWPLGDDFYRIAVISPSGAAGLGDFRADADRLQHYQLVEFRYFEAVFEGDRAAPSFQQALSELHKAHAACPFEAVALIRGGGASTGLAWLNQQAICEPLCQLPLPLLTGIGHERDRTLVDEIACRAFDTPSKVIHFIRDKVLHSARQAQRDFDSIVRQSHQQAQQRAQQLELAQRQLRLNALKPLQRAQAALHTQHSVLAHSARQQISRSNGQLALHRERSVSRARQHIQQQRLQLTAQHHALRQAVRQPLNQAHQHLRRRQRDCVDSLPRILERLRQQCQSLLAQVLGFEPQRVLRRGFTRVRTPAGQSIVHARSARKYPQLELEFHDGRLLVRPEPPKDE